MDSITHKYVRGRDFSMIAKAPSLTRHTIQADVMDWYVRAKEGPCKCLTCQKESWGRKHIVSGAELHHIDRSEKCDTVSKLLHHKVHPGAIFEEFLKCIPLCNYHHKDYHKAEDKGNIEYINERYDFEGNSYYQRKINQFRNNVFMLAPSSLKKDLALWQTEETIREQIKSNRFNF